MTELKNLVENKLAQSVVLSKDFVKVKPVVLDSDHEYEVLNEVRSFKKKMDGIDWPKQLWRIMEIKDEQEPIITYEVLKKPFSLRDYIKSNGKFTNPTLTLNIFENLIQTCKTLKSMKLPHGYISSKYIYLGKDDKWKIGGYINKTAFCSFIFNETNTDLAPEIFTKVENKTIDKVDFNEKVDVWGLCNVFLEMLTKNYLDSSLDINSGKYTDKLTLILKSVNQKEKGLIKILSKGLDSNPKKRPDIEELSSKIKKLLEKNDNTFSKSKPKPAKTADKYELIGTKSDFDIDSNGTEACATETESYSNRGKTLKKQPNPLKITVKDNLVIEEEGNDNKPIEVKIKEVYLEAIEIAISFYEKINDNQKRIFFNNIYSIHILLMNKKMDFSTKELSDYEKDIINENNEDFKKYHEELMDPKYNDVFQNLEVEDVYITDEKYFLSKKKFEKNLYGFSKLVQSKDFEKSNNYPTKLLKLLKLECLLYTIYFKELHKEDHFSKMFDVLLMDNNEQIEGWLDEYRKKYSTLNSHKLEDVDFQD